MNTLRKPRKNKPWPQTIYALTVTRDEAGQPVDWGWCDARQSPAKILYGHMDDEGLDKLHGLMDDAIHPQSDALIVMDLAYANLTAMGVWREIKAGRWTLKGTDERRPSAPRCIVEDPPTIIHYGSRGMGGYAVICDVANWGWTIPENTELACVVRNVSLRSPAYERTCLMIRAMSIRQFVTEYEKILRSCNLGDSWRMTAGSQSFYGFRQSYMDSPIEASRCDESESLIERCSYGGRCECFFLGEMQGPIYQYDVNQLYSWVASVAKLPVECLGDCMSTVRGMPVKEMWNVAADVLIKAECNIYPYRSSGESGDRGVPLVIYPIGEFRTFLAGPELQLAVDCGHVKEFYAAYQYRTEPCLAKWAATMWEARVLAEPHLKKMIKVLSLSLYGKFGQRLREWSPDDDACPPASVDVGDWYTARDGGGVNRHRVLCGQCATEITGGYVQQSSPPIAAWTTSLARLYLQQLMNEAGQCYYCDTDSLWVDREAHLRLQASKFVGTDLGQLRLVADWERVDFRGIKHYAAEGELSHSGVPERAERIGECHYRWQEDCTFGGHMNSREWPSKKIVVRSHRGTSLYRHGVPQPDGRVLPHVLT